MTTYKFMKMTTYKFMKKILWRFLSLVFILILAWLWIIINPKPAFPQINTIKYLTPLTITTLL
jgi:hypothetical protein